MSIDLGLFILRVTIGLLFLGHGTQKLFGWFGGPGLGGVRGWLGSLGLRPTGFWAVMAGLSEAGGGLLLALGLLSPLGSIGITAAMLMAIVAVHWPKFWVTEGGIEYPLVNIAAVTALAFAGPGRWALGYQLPMPWTWIAGIVVVLIGTGIALSTGERQAPAASQDAPGEAREEQRAA